MSPLGGQVGREIEEAPNVSGERQTVLMGLGTAGSLGQPVDRVALAAGFGVDH